MRRRGEVQPRVYPLILEVLVALDRLPVGEVGHRIVALPGEFGDEGLVDRFHRHRRKRGDADHQGKHESPEHSKYPPRVPDPSRGFDAGGGGRVSGPWSGAFGAAAARRDRPLTLPSPRCGGERWKNARCGGERVKPGFRAFVGARVDSRPCRSFSRRRRNECDESWSPTTSPSTGSCRRRGGRTRTRATGSATAAGRCRTTTRSRARPWPARGRRAPTSCSGAAPMKTSIASGRAGRTTPSRKCWTVRGSTSSPGPFVSRCPGRTRPCCRATPPSPWPG